jgi:hypothetical protein
MSQREDFLTPVGRLVQGSLYTPNTQDLEGRPLVIKNGVNAGSPRVDFYFGVAIPKTTEHWSQTEWGAKIWAVGHAAFPQGQANSPGFAWKITDGDSTVVNKAGKKPCDKDGYPGHWILNLSSSFAPGIYNDNGSKVIVEKDAVKLGDYIQVYGNVSGNDSMQQPGVFLNHNMVALAGYGERIVTGADPRTLGFGVGAALPPGASKTPKATNFNPTPVPIPPVITPEYVFPPYTPILNVPGTTTPAIATMTAPSVVSNIPISTPTPQKIMTPAAGAYTYEQYIANGWTDQQLIQNGFMQA